MKTKKSLLSLLLVFVMLFSMVACDSGTTSDETKDSTSSEASSSDSTSETSSEESSVASASNEKSEDVSTVDSNESSDEDESETANSESSSSVKADGPAAEMDYEPGTYSATATGHHSEITLDVTFDESSITDIKVTDQGETAEIFKPVEEVYIPAIIENQSLAVDTVSGSTSSSNAVLTALKDTIEQAGEDPAKLENVAVAEKEKGDDEEITTDVVVVGSGASGFVSAITAKDQGADVVVLEKASNLGAVNGVKVSGPFAVDTPTLHERGTTLTVDDVFFHAMEYTHWTPNASLIRKSLDRSKDAVAVLSDIGYEFKEANFRFETPFVDEKGGFHLILNDIDERIQMWETAYEERGIDVHYSTRATELLTDGDGKVVGVVATRDDGSTLTVNANAVILATGGYLGNEEMLVEKLGTAHVNAAAGGQSLATGDGIRMAQDVGAGVDKTWGLIGSEYGGTNSKASRPAMQDKFDQNMAFKFGVYGNLLVDKQGKRFMNEGMMCDYPMSFGSEPTLRNSPYYAVVDQAYVDAMRDQGLFEYMTSRGANEENWFIGNYYKDRVITTLDEDIEEGIEEGWIVKANTIEELAEAYDLEYLEETVEQYNGFCEAGEDPQFGVNPWYLSEVSTGPFYVIENEVSAWSTTGGVRTDDNCRALTPENEVIEGLYVVGTDNGSLMYSPYYDIPGMGYGLSIDTGVIAGEHAAQFSQE